MNKDFAASFVMTFFLFIFGVPLSELTGESRIMPEIVIWFMAAFTIGQYVLTIYQVRKGTSIIITLDGYPLVKVGLLVALTTVYLLSLDHAGFYLASYIYFVVVTLLAQPMAITPKGIAIRAVTCGLCVLFLYLLFTVMLSVQIPLGIFQ